MDDDALNHTECLLARRLSAITTVLADYVELQRITQDTTWLSNDDDNLQGDLLMAVIACKAQTYRWLHQIKKYREGDDDEEARR